MPQRNPKIAVIAAMKEELSALQELTEEINIQKDYSQHQAFSDAASPLMEYHYGKIHNVEIVAIQSGVGKAQAAMRTALLLQKHSVELVINIGSAGGLLEANHGDLVIAEELCYHDADVRTFGYELGQLPGSPARFYTKHEYLPRLLNLANQLGKQAFLGLIVSGDTFVEHGSPHVDRICRDFPHALAVEMEAASIAHCCHIFQCPCLIVRSISDFPKLPEGKANFQEYLPLAAQNSAHLIKDFINSMQ